MTKINNRLNLIQHHIRYKELHGVDEIIWMSPSDHKKLHIRLRKEAKCCVPVNTLRKIALDAHCRTEKRKRYMKEYGQLESIKKNHKNNFQTIEFTEMFGHHTQFHEMVVYNHKTGNITYSARFRSTGGYILPVLKRTDSMNFGVDVEL